MLEDYDDDDGFIKDDSDDDDSVDVQIDRVCGVGCGCCGVVCRYRSTSCR